MTLDITAYVERHLKEYRAELRAKTMFGPAGRQVIRSQGERVVVGPNGRRIRVTQLPAVGVGHTQVEHEDELGDTHIHANVRPAPLTAKLTFQ
jgi:hypothetical protein